MQTHFGHSRTVDSLNLHFAGNYSVTKCRSQSTLLKFGQRTFTNRTHFFSWPNQQIDSAIGAFDRVKYDSFDIHVF